MPPKKLQNTRTMSSMHSNQDSRMRTNIVGDLVTASEAALSSQASIYQQRTQASQYTNITAQYNDDDGHQYNREQISEVFISKQQQQIIQKILQLARKGKVNSNNAFDIPIKVMHSENTSSINNKFWKFSSQLLGASMNIYDKRVQNMYLSTGAFQNKLSRVGFHIKNKSQNGMEESEVEDDNIQTDQQRRRMKDRSQRQQLLSISIQDFQGLLNLQDDEVIGIQTLQKKQKIDIKTIQLEFIADPTFLRTQLMFDSYSVKSLMLNIFPFSTNLDVRIFHKSDLEWKNMHRNSQHDNQNQMMKQRQNQMMGNNNYEQDSEQKQQETIKTQTLTQNISNDQFSNSTLPYKFQKHLQISKRIAQQNQFMKQITQFKLQQFQLVKDFQNRNPTNFSSLRQENNSKIKQQPDYDEDQQVQKDRNQSQQLTFKEISEKQMKEFNQLIKQIDHNFDPNEGKHRFQEIENGEGLFQTNNMTQSQPPDYNQDQSFYSNHVAPLSENIFYHDDPNNSAPVSANQFSFFQWNHDNNSMQPIMPWQIEFKDNKLIKKRKKGSKKNTNKQKKNPHLVQVDFGLQIFDRSKVLLSTQIKSHFLSNKSRQKAAPVQKNLLNKGFDYICSQYHQGNNPNYKFSMSKSQKNYSQRTSQKENKRYDNSFVLDIDFNANFTHTKNQKNPFDEQTRMNQPQSGYNVFEGFQSQPLQRRTHNTSYVGNQMGIHNIRQVKNFIKRELDQKGQTDLWYVKRLLPNLSQQQIFTIFLHLTNQHQLLITSNQDQTNILLNYPQNNRQTKRQRRNLNKSVLPQIDDLEI